ncbi:hypothetical protein BQ8482_111146 [Mesorhizobium delmotii]|uniref:Uncharacterized protein n=1 Tax=Mesorhizobium delmotii TaxID=1631247 RepID=A0A2P9ADN8_9HYPH|nr:hypothetical protein BQ8482_111146 [Mesorhizobium delmotii]
MPSSKSSFVRFAYCRSGRKVNNGNLRAESLGQRKSRSLRSVRLSSMGQGRTPRSANGQSATRPLAACSSPNPARFFEPGAFTLSGPCVNIFGQSARVAHLQESTDQPTSLLQPLLLDADSMIAAFYSPCTGWAAFCWASDITLAAAMAACFSWRLIVNGYLPDYAYARGALDTRLPLSTLRELAHIDDRARKSGLSPDFSRLIRVDVPSPRLGY